VHDPATFEFYRDSFSRMLGLFPISGVTWGGVKNLQVQDYSEAARRALAVRVR
jgi:hypothetical protein